MLPTPHADVNEHRNLWFFDTLVYIRVSETDSEDGVSVLEHHAACGDSPPLHVHADEDEIFHVIDGEVRFQLGDHLIRVSRGDTIVAPRGVPHTYRVDSRTGGRLMTITSNKSFERFVRSVGRPAASEDLPVQSGPPSPEQMKIVADAALACGIEFVGPPLA